MNSTRAKTPKPPKTLRRNTTAKADHSPPRERRQGVQSVETGMGVLKGLAHLGGRASLTALSTRIGHSPAKVHRYLVSLMQEGLVAQDAASQHYYLGAEAIQIGLAAMRQADPIRVIEPALLPLCEELGLTCFITVMGNKGPTIVRFEEPGLPVTINVRIGSVMSLLWSAAGRTFLAYLDDPHIRTLAQEELKNAPPELRGQVNAEDFIGRLQRTVRSQGCGTVKDTYLRGISAVAAPLFDHHGKLCAVLAALGSTGSFDATAKGPVAVALCREAQAASRQLGHVQGHVSGHAPDPAVT